MSETILFVDDDANVLSGIQRQLRGRYTLEVANGGVEALHAVSLAGPFAVIVSDMRMPGMDGVQLLRKTREMAPQTVRIMLTGATDMHTAIEAVNEGNIFRFLAKPCTSDNLARALDAGLEQYRLITAEKEFLEKTLSGSVQVLSDTLSLVNPAAFGRATRLKRYVRHMIAAIECADGWQYEMAAMLSQLGCVALPARMVEKVYRGEPLGPEEAALYDGHPATAGRLLAHIPRLGSVAQMVAAQRHPCGASAAAPRMDPVHLGSRMLHVALGVDDRLFRGMKAGDALEEMARRPEEYDAQLVSAMGRMDLRSEDSSVGVSLDESRIGMVLVHDVRARNGLLLVARGQDVTHPVLEFLHNFAANVGIVEPLHVLSQSEVLILGEQDGRRNAA